MNIQKVERTTSFKIVDRLLLILTILPLFVGIVLKVLFTPASEGVNVTGAMVYFTIPMPLQDLPITESQINSWLIILSVLFLCLYLTHGITMIPQSKRQLLCEWIVDKVNGLIKDNMGERFSAFAPFIAAIMGLSALSSLITLIGLYSPTADVNVIAGWSILVLILITYYKCKAGFAHYLKGFTQPVAILTPINIISEVATPISMTFRHFGNVLSGSVISVLIAYALQNLSALVLGWLPGVLGEFPLLQIGLPGILSLYFDIFSGALQAFIFAMLTMIYVSDGFPVDAYEARKAKKAQKHSQKANVALEANVTLASK